MIPLLSFLLLLLLLPLSTLSSPLPLFPLTSPSPHPLRSLSHSSLLRATFLKKSPSLPSITPLSPHSFGGYSLSLSLGSPPLPFPFLFDTASHLSWLPCTHTFNCLHCHNFTSPPSLYLPKSSLSSRLIGCQSPFCKWIHPLKSCTKSDTTNSTSLCPPYLLIYGSGSTGGLLMLDKLLLPGRILNNFVFGCSLFSEKQPPIGLIGFGRGPPSVPGQLGLTRFAYCLISRNFDDDRSVSGSLFLNGSDDGKDLQFVPFVKNPTKSEPFSVYYYLDLRKITVGGKKLNLLERILSPQPNGNGGTIIDTGTTFTYMEPNSFKLLETEFTSQVGTRYNRSFNIESHTGLKPCFILPSKSSKITVPDLVFHFKGGTEMRLPLENYFVVAGPADVADQGEAVCLAVVSDGAAFGVASGPGIVIGSFQQQNYYVEYDLVKERLGFRRQSCILH
ncbi:hypothetical protein LUZ60_016030 [Juncus effusus]|nr:hypothetical protein LUZ60_016030 [Juncus effusus]